MILPILQEAVMKAERKIDLAIINVTVDQKWHMLRVHGVDLEQ